MLMSLAAVTEILANPSNGDLFVIARRPNNEWKVTIAVTTPPAILSREPQFDLSSGKEEKEKDDDKVVAEDVASRDGIVASDKTKDDGNDNGHDVSPESPASTTTPKLSTENAAIAADYGSDSDDDSVDYGLSQEFSFMAEIMGDDE